MKKQTQLIRVIKRIYLNSSDFFLPSSNVIKYPIFLDNLKGRIRELQAKYSLSKGCRVFDLSFEKKIAQKELKWKGGVYVLWCKPTGMFYVGSALRFFTNKGRLTDYFFLGRVKASLKGVSSKISKDLALQISTFGIDNFTLLIPQEDLSDKLNKSFFQDWEQFWMMLNPTLNRSLMVSSNSGFIMSEEDRMELSTVIYQYEIEDNKIIPQSQKLLFGLKETSRIGITNDSGLHFPIQYDTLKGHFENRIMWKDKFLFLPEPINDQNVISISLNNNNIDQTKGIWVYDAMTNKFISYEKSVKECEKKYNISKTHLKRVRKYNQPYQGKLFSNKKV